MQVINGGYYKIDLEADEVYTLRLLAHISLSLGPEMEKVMATHSSTLAWKIPWAEDPGWLQSMGSLRLGHD